MYRNETAKLVPQTVRKVIKFLRSKILAAMHFSQAAVKTKSKRRSCELGGHCLPAGRQVLR